MLVIIFVLFFLFVSVFMVRFWGGVRVCVWVGAWLLLLGVFWLLGFHFCFFAFVFGHGPNGQLNVVLRCTRQPLSLSIADMPSLTLR